MPAAGGSVLRLIVKAGWFIVKQQLSDYESKT